MGIPLNNRTILYTLHFLDDEVVVAHDQEDLEFVTTRLISEYKKWGLSYQLKN